MLEIINANVYAFMRANQTLKGTKFCLRPLSKSNDERMPEPRPAILPPQTPNAADKTTSIGITSNAATILGIMRYAFVLMPMISSASICSLTRILPSSLAILLPTTPPSTIQTRVGSELQDNGIPYNLCNACFWNDGANQLVSRLYGRHSAHKKRNDYYDAQ